MKQSDVTDGSFVDVRYNFKNPRTNSYIWTGTVLTIGHKAYCEREAASARIQVTEADGNVSFVPVVQRPDPDLTIYEDVNQNLLQEDQEVQLARKKSSLSLRLKKVFLIQLLKLMVAKMLS